MWILHFIEVANGAIVIILILITQTDSFNPFFSLIWLSFRCQRANVGWARSLVSYACIDIFTASRGVDCKSALSLILYTYPREIVRDVYYDTTTAAGVVSKMLKRSEMTG